MNCNRKQLVPLGLLKNTLGDHWNQDLVNLFKDLELYFVRQWSTINNID
jgi:hypothetical protein